MTIYKPIKIEAETAAEVAVAIANGADVGETCSYLAVSIDSVARRVRSSSGRG